MTLSTATKPVTFGNFNRTGGETGRRSGPADRVKPAGYINIYLPTAGGKKRKLDSIPVYDNEQNAQLLAYLNENPENIHAVMKMAQIDYRAAVTDGSGAFAIPGEEISEEAPGA